MPRGIMQLDQVTQLVHGWATPRKGREQITKKCIYFWQEASDWYWGGAGTVSLSACHLYSTIAPFLFPGLPVGPNS